MKRLALLISLFLIALLTINTSCKCEKDDPPAPAYDSSVKLIFELYNDADSMAWNEIVSVDNVNEYRMEFFKFYQVEFFNSIMYLFF